VRRAALARRNGRPQRASARKRGLRSRRLTARPPGHPAEGISARRGDVRRGRLGERVAVMNGGRLDAPVGDGLPHFTGTVSWEFATSLTRNWPRPSCSPPRHRLQRPPAQPLRPPGQGPGLGIIRAPAVQFGVAGVLGDDRRDGPAAGRRVHAVVAGRMTLATKRPSARETSFKPPPSSQDIPGPGRCLLTGVQPEPARRRDPLHLAEVEGEGLPPALGLGAVGHEPGELVEVGVGVLPDRPETAGRGDVGAH